MLATRNQCIKVTLVVGEENASNHACAIAKKPCDDGGCGCCVGITNSNTLVCDVYKEIAQQRKIGS